MHLADFSYTERLLQNSTFFVLFLIHLGLQTRFKDIRRRRRNVKMAVFSLTMLSLLGWIIMDIMTIYLKYIEWRDPSRNCMPRRQSQYTQDHYDMTRAMKYYFNVVWTLQSSALFLLLVFIRNLTHGYVAIGSSTEYVFYQVWAPSSILLYPLMTSLFDYAFTGMANHVLLANVMPQIVNHVESLFVAVMLWRSRRALIVGAQRLTPESRQAIVERFDWPIRFCCFFLLMDVGGLATINLDVVLSDPVATGPVYRSAFASDFCISIFSVGLTGSHVAVLYLLYPPERHTRAFEGSPDNRYRSKSIAMIAPDPSHRAAEQPAAAAPKSVFDSAKEPSSLSTAAEADDAETKKPLVPQATVPLDSAVPSQANTGEAGNHSRVSVP